MVPSPPPYRAAEQNAVSDAYNIRKQNIEAHDNLQIAGQRKHYSVVTKELEESVFRQRSGCVCSPHPSPPLGQYRLPRPHSAVS